MTKTMPYTGEEQMATHLEGLAARMHLDESAAEKLEDQLMGMTLTLSAGTTSRQTRRYWRGWMAAALLVVVLVSTVLAVPPLRSLAQALIDSIFVHAESDQQLTNFSAYDLNSVLHLTDLDEVNALESKIDFDVLLPTFIPEGYDFAEAERYSFRMGHQVSLTYQDGNLRLFIDQTPLTEGDQPEFQVGASAEIVQVPIQWGDGTVVASYVEGDWAFPLEPGAPTPAAGAAFSGVGVWHAEFPKHQLVWTADGMFYRITSVAVVSPTDGAVISREEMVRVAEGLK